MTDRVEPAEPDDHADRCVLCHCLPDGYDPDYPHVTVATPQANCQRGACPMRVPFSNRQPLDNVRGWFGGRQDQ